MDTILVIRLGMALKQLIKVFMDEIWRARDGWGVIVLIQDEIHIFSEMVEVTLNQEAAHGSDRSNQKGRLLKQPVEVFVEVENMIYVWRNVQVKIKER